MGEVNCWLLSTLFADSRAVLMSRTRLPPSFVCIFISLLALADLAFAHSDGAAKGVAPARDTNDSSYLGSTSCRPCHAAVYDAWTGSDHDLAMQEATAGTVLGDFADATFEAFGVTSTFSRQGGKFFVRTDGPDGALANYEVKYVFGVRPLQQYLVAFPGGRLQSLPLAWDSRSKSQGGARWFHLYPEQQIDHADQLHWTGIYQNWNLQCASCHSTNLRKNYSGASNTYATTFAELNVACESCHGSGAEHAKWAKSATPPYDSADLKGFGVSMKRPASDAWTFASADARYASRPLDAQRDAAATTRMNTCAPCHARRSTITENQQPGSPLENSHRLALLTTPLYFADGQQRDEVYTWGSFLQSKMFAKGVVCSDCHDSHSLKLRASGNALCAQCHNPSLFDTKAHHFHEPGGKGAQCVECHMPARDYMVIDGRRDHSFHVPRPDKSEETAAPNACSGCHVGRTDAWASDAMDGWYGPGWRKRSEYGSILRKVDTEGAKALAPLMSLAADASSPAIVRATAASLSQPLLRPGSLAETRALLSDDEPLLRLAAVGLLQPFETRQRVESAAPLLGDPVRSVRIEAARILADVPDSELSVPEREARARARQEYLDSLRLESDWPATLVALGNFELAEGRVDEATVSFRRAMALDPRFVGAYANLADAYRAQGKDAEGEAVLRKGLEASPEAGGLHHALGLLLVRDGNKTDSLEHLSKAASLEPDNARFAYVYAVALHSAGRLDESLTALAAANKTHPYNVDILGALVSMNLEAGNPGAVLPYAKSLAEVMPNDSGLRQLIAGLERIGK